MTRKKHISFKIVAKKLQKQPKGKNEHLLVMLLF